MRVSTFGPAFGLLALAAFLVSSASEAARWPVASDRTIRLEVADGCLEIELRPDRGKALSLMSEGPHLWTFQGATSALVGESYSIQLRNRTSRRLKVVVGVDGLNLYRRQPIVGRSEADVGSILSPWSDRSLPGWQLDGKQAQRFVFSPPEWSEGQGQTDSQIGLISVEVYEEVRSWLEEDEWHGGREERSMSEQRRAPAPAPEIGTTTGEDIVNPVRRVPFLARTSYPEAWAKIDYGRNRARPIPEPNQILLGLDLHTTRDGVRVTTVRRGSQADQAGIEPADLIVRIDTESRPSLETLRRVLSRKNHGDYVFLRVRRGHNELALKIRT